MQVHEAAQQPVHESPADEEHKHHVGEVRIFESLWFHLVALDPRAPCRTEAISVTPEREISMRELCRIHPT